MFKKCLMTFSFCLFLPLVAIKPVIVKKKKKVSTKTIKQQIPELCGEGIKESLNLIDELSLRAQDLVQLVEDIARECDALKTKDQCEACQNKVLKYNQIIKDTYKKITSLK